MSTALANFAGVNSLTDFQAVNLLYKKYLGLPNVYPSGAALQEPSIGSRPKVFANLQVFSQTVPATAPSDLVEDVSWNTFNASVAASPYTPTRYYSSANPHIVKYTNLPITDTGVNAWIGYKADMGALKDSTGNNYTNAIRLLSQAIPSNYDPGASYRITVTNKTTGNEIAQFNNGYPWALDGDAGFLTFYGASVDGLPPLQKYNVVPTITFWRYEGTLGVGSTSAPATTANSVTVENADAGRLVMTKDASGNLKALSDITYSNGILDVSGVLTLKNVTLDTAGDSDYKLTLPTSLPNTAANVISYLASDASGNMIWRNSTVDAIAYIKTSGNFYLKNAGQSSAMILNDGSMDVDEGLQRIDNWLYNYIVSSPPQITDLSCSAITTTYVEFGWSFPLQLNVGIADQYLPRIDSLSIEYKTTGSYLPVLTNDTTSVNQKITKLRLYKGSGSNGISGGIYNIYSISSLSSSGNSLKIWYSNKNSSPSVFELPFNGYANSLAPSAPTITSITTTSPAANLNLALTITSPVQADPGDPANSTISIAKYIIDINNTEYTYTPNASTSATIKNTSFTITLTSGSTSTTNGSVNPAPTFSPNTTYAIKVKASNSTNSLIYGTFSTSVNGTTGIVNAGAYTFPTTLNIPNSNYTNTSNVMLYNSGTVVSERVYKNTIEQAATAITNIPILVTANAGSTATGIMTLASKVTENGTDYNGPTISFDGIGTANSVKDTNVADIRIRTGADTADATYPSLYKSVSSATISITNNDTANNHPLMPSQYAKTLKMLYTTDVKGTPSTSTATATYRVDDVTGAPVASNGVIQLTTSSYKPITGLQVLDTSATNKFKITASLNNIGGYYVANQYMSYAVVGSGKPTISPVNDSATSHLTGSTNGKLNATGVTYDSGVDSITLSASSTNYANGDFQLQLTPKNLDATGSSISTTTLYSLIDHASVTFLNDISLYPSSLPSLNTSSFVSGRHVNFPGFTSTILNIPSSSAAYNHSSWGTYDPLITQGSFLAASGSGYPNFINTRNGNGTSASGSANANLSSITSNHNWVVYAWNIPYLAAGFNQIKLNYIGGSASATYYCVTDSTNSKQMYWVNANTPYSGTDFTTDVQNSAKSMVNGGQAATNAAYLVAGTGTNNSATVTVYVAVQLSAGSSIKSVQLQGTT